MQSEVLPISHLPLDSSFGSSQMLVRSEIQNGATTTILNISSQIEEDDQAIKPLLSRTASFTSSTVPGGVTIGNYNQKRRRRSPSESSLDFAYSQPRRQSFSKDVGHAAAETFLVTRLSLKLLRYLGYNLILIFSFMIIIMFVIDSNIFFLAYRCT